MDKLQTIYEDASKQDTLTAVYEDAALSAFEEQEKAGFETLDYSKADAYGKRKVASYKAAQDMRQRIKARDLEREKQRSTKRRILAMA